MTLDFAHGEIFTEEELVSLSANQRRYMVQIYTI